jgi:hypothetical protein
MRVDSMALGERPLIPVGVGAGLDVHAVGLEQVLGHRLETFRPVDLQRHPSSDGPGREDQIGISHGVIRVQMGDEGDAQLGDLERLDAFLAKCSRGAADDARPEVDKVGGLIHDDGCGRAGPFWKRSRRAGP